MQELVFDPLGMTATTVDYPRAEAGNHAAPHGTDVDGKTVVASMDLNIMEIPSRPSGIAFSNIRDMTRYVQMELANGLLPDGRRYIAEDVLLARRKPQAADGLASFVPQWKAGIAAERETLTVPADPAAAGQLATHYRNSALGDIAVRRERGTTVFDFGG